MSLLAKLGRDFETEARMIIAWLWAPLKTGLECMLRVGLRSSTPAMIAERFPGFPGITPLRPDLRDGADRKAVSPRRIPKRFLAARRGGE